MSWRNLLQITVMAIVNTGVIIWAYRAGWRDARTFPIKDSPLP